MAIRKLKAPVPASELAASGAAQTGVAELVKNIIDDVQKRGDAAVAEYSLKFDKWGPKRLSVRYMDADKLGVR
jgi:sulfopropanediol 3-dehydrogenase